MKSLARIWTETRASRRDHRASRLLSSASIFGRAECGSHRLLNCSTDRRRCGAEVDGDHDIAMPDVECHYCPHCGTFTHSLVDLSRYRSGNPQHSDWGLPWSTFIEESHVFLIERSSGGSDNQTRPYLALSCLSKDNPGFISGQNSRIKSYSGICVPCPGVCRGDG